MSIKKAPATIRAKKIEALFEEIMQRLAQLNQASPPAPKPKQPKRLH